MFTIKLLFLLSMLSLLRQQLFEPTVVLCWQVAKASFFSLYSEGTARKINQSKEAQREMTTSPSSRGGVWIISRLSNVPLWNSNTFRSARWPSLVRVGSERERERGRRKRGEDPHFSLQAVVLTDNRCDCFQVKPLLSGCLFSHPRRLPALCAYQHKHKTGKLNCFLQLQPELDEKILFEKRTSDSQTKWDILSSRRWF